MSGQFHLTPRDRACQNSSYRRLGGPQSQSRCCIWWRNKSLSLPGIRLRSFSYFTNWPILTYREKKHTVFWWGNLLESSQFEDQE